MNNNHFPMKFENGNSRYLILKIIDEIIYNFSYFGDLNNLFDSFEFYQQLFLYFKNEVEVNNFNQRIMSMIDIKI
jgi:hypothetical protein